MRLRLKPPQRIRSRLLRDLDVIAKHCLPKQPYDLSGNEIVKELGLPQTAIRLLSNVAQPNIRRNGPSVGRYYRLEQFDSATQMRLLEQHTRLLAVIQRKDVTVIPIMGFVNSLAEFVPADVAHVTRGSFVLFIYPEPGRVVATGKQFRLVLEDNTLLDVRSVCSGEGKIE